MAPQRLEKIESAPVNGMGSEASSHNIWYTGARLTVRSGREPQERCRIRPARRPEGNFPPRKALKSLETEKESRKLRGRDEQTGDRAAAPAGAPLALTLAAPGLEPSPAELGKLQKKAPKVLKSLDAKLKSALGATPFRRRRNSRRATPPAPPRKNGEGRSPYPAYSPLYVSRSAAFCTLPIALRGNSSTKITRLGAL